MKAIPSFRFIPCALALLAILALSTGLRAATPAETLCGTWEISQSRGPQSLLGYSIFNPDGTGASVARMAMQGQTMWMVVLYTWKIDGDKVVQTVTRTNVTSLPPGKTSTDTIVLLNETTYEHRAGKKTEQEKRVAALPEEFAKKLTKFRGQ